jgi:hypothetical protein
MAPGNHNARGRQGRWEPLTGQDARTEIPDIHHLAAASQGRRTQPFEAGQVQEVPVGAVARHQ